MRLLVGARVDKFDIIEDVQFSPRTTLMLKPSADQTIRVSYNRAYRAPSVINNFLDTAIINQLPLGIRAVNPALAGTRLQLPDARRRQQRRRCAAVPPQDLVEQSITAYEIGYTGVIKQRATVSAAFFFNETKDDIFFTQVASYRASQPAAAVAAAADSAVPGSSSSALLPAGTTPRAARPCPFGAGNGLPSAFSYRNLGKVQQKGLELGIDGAFTKEWSGFANYSYQPDPKAIGFPQSEINLPPNNRFNVGVNYGGVAVPGQPRRQLPGRGVLAGRARQPLRGHHRRLHAGQRHLRREVGQPSATS